MPDDFSAWSDLHQKIIWLAFGGLQYIIKIGRDFFADHLHAQATMA